MQSRKPKYFVYYCTMDQEVGANPLWHTCLLLVKENVDAKKLEVIERVGFYGLPTTQGDSLGRKVKIAVGMDVDFTGNLGMLRNEEIRYLNTGSGLHYVPFEVTEERFLAAQKRIHTMKSKQEEVIKAVKDAFGLKGKKNPRIFDLEQFGPYILALEEAAAAEQNRSPRVKRFALSVREPHTCKMKALDLVDGIISDEGMEHIIGWHEAVSRWSGKMEDLSLHCTGPLVPFTKRSGEVVYNIDETSPDTHIWVAVPPQMHDYLSDEAIELFEIPGGYASEVKESVKRLKKLEGLIRNADVDQKYFPLREKLDKKIGELLEPFMTLQPKTAQVKDDSWSGYYRWKLYGEPRDADEERVYKALAKVNAFFHAVAAGMEMESVSETKPASLASVLKEEYKMKICEALGIEVTGNEELIGSEMIRAMC